MLLRATGRDHKLPGEYRLRTSTPARDVVFDVPAARQVQFAVSSPGSGGRSDRAILSCREERYEIEPP
jgi:hypothetical protein